MEVLRIGEAPGARSQTPLLHLLPHNSSYRHHGIFVEPWHDRECPSDRGAHEHL